MLNKGWAGKPIDVVRMLDRGLTSVDNTRLLAANRSGIDVRAIVHNFADPIPDAMAGRFISPTGAVPGAWGEAVSNRIASQGRLFARLYSNGAPFTGWAGN